MSILFAALESYFIQGCNEEEINKYLNETADRIEELNKKLNVISSFVGFSVSTKIIQKDQSSQYFLLILDTKEKTIETRGYKNKDLDFASAEYIDLEKQFRDDKRFNIALVSASSIQSLKVAYPNYFVNSQMFLENLAEAFQRLGRELK